MPEIQITINGEEKIVTSETVAELLVDIGLGDTKVAVERNKEIVSRASYNETPLHDGDQIEIVHFVGGG